jgi:hypothetical protein
MKLRIKGDSLRYRVSPSEVARLLQTGRVEETVHFAPESDAKLIYALECTGAERKISICYRPQEVSVLLARTEALSWAEGEQVGIYDDVNLGTCILAVSIEKDFACLDAGDRDNKDTFPNPKSGQVC